MAEGGGASDLLRVLLGKGTPQYRLEQVGADGRKGWLCFLLIILKGPAPLYGHRSLLLGETVLFCGGSRRPHRKCS